MPLELVTLPCLSDNYTFLIHDHVSGATAVVDVPDPAPILAALAERGWTLTDVFLTHHHWDHVDGLPGLLEKAPARVWGAAADADRLPPLDHALADGDTFEFGGETVHVLDVSGHTLGHIAYYLPASELVFTGDSLMAAGCGRLFEGSPEVMWQSLSKFSAFSGETLVCSGHEYTASNIRFALALDPAHAATILRAGKTDEARSAGLATVPSTLALERQTNPFLRASDPALKTAIGMADAPDAEVFAEIRRRKDNF